jgi:hypothetical protein
MIKFFKVKYYYVLLRMGQYLISTILDIEIIRKILNFKISILPINSIFGYAWIIFWFIGIWVFHIQFFLMGLFCLILSFTDFKSENKNDIELPFILSRDKETKTLTIETVKNEDLYWEDTEICSGEGILPEGIVEKGNIIYNCKGNVSIRHIPSNIIIGGFNFD